MPDNKELYAQLDAAIAELKDQPGALMPVLQRAQNIFGCVPLDVQKIIAKGLGTTLSEVYGVATFYAQFTLRPAGKYTISVCLGTACYVKGAQMVIDKFSDILGIKPGETTDDAMFTLDALRCIGACAIAPAVSINGKVYPKVAVNSVQGIIDEYRAKEA